jgi:hypothetical protein
MPKHIDGMSSDDEVTEQQNLAFKQAKGNGRILHFHSYSKMIFNLIIFFSFHYR